ncbi:Myb-like DNA-binding domain containing protein [Tritrichomonas foetus]|uniref:Myb-like DNA-binding domain containing protein n=1 Tax=Tritrichomonas foetus TaxID=1144522 RepID=A0A1J4KFK6_9EUKA|nr:Myb-like DNA-binding domain containing protein [Tritrichomonas foetus]|eukprot:OHT09987.1 Myb-like DNA-binding domain containing protein [Tritrichomonas foetus]
MNETLQSTSPNSKKAEPLAPTRSRVRTQTRSKNPNWTQEEDMRLTELISKYPEPKWQEITRHFPGKGAHQVADRWAKVLNPSLVKGSWTGEEDAKIVKWVAENGPKNWGALAALLPGRISKQCRERWHNHLSPDVNKKDWTPEEDKILIDRQKLWGNKWSQIAADLPGRTDNAVKNRWNSSLKRRLERIERGQSPSGKRGRKPKRASEAPNLIDEGVPKPPIDDMPETMTLNGNSLGVSGNTSSNTNVMNTGNTLNSINTISSLNSIATLDTPLANAFSLDNGKETPQIPPQFSPTLPSPATPVRFLFSPGWSPTPTGSWALTLSPFPPIPGDSLDKNDLVNIPGPKLD